MARIDHNSINNHIVTPIKPYALSQWLQGYDRNTSNFLVNGFLNGFHIPFHGILNEKPVKNLQSAYRYPSEVSKAINIELLAQRLAGPFTEKPFDHIHFSPVGVVEKKTKGEFRFIQHLSYPEGSSINDGIPKELCSVQYQSIDDAVSLIQKFGPGAYMAKTDIEKAFKLIPIAPDSQHLLAFTHLNCIYYDKTLPMGLSYSCSLFETFSTALQWIATEKLGISGCVHILDDFMFVSPPQYHLCFSSLQTFLGLAEELGVPIKHEKTMLPDTVMSFMGIELDSNLMVKRLPLDKIEKIRFRLQSLKFRRKVTLEELQSLIGLLNFACAVVTPGRCFLRRLIDLTIGLKKPHHKRRLTTEARADLEAWTLFIEGFNGTAIMLEDTWNSSATLHLYTDSSNTGFGGYLKNRYFADTWPLNSIWQHCHITVKELYPIVLALEVWGHRLQNKCIVFHSDNEAVVYIINRQTSKDKTLMKLVRRLVLCTIKHNVMFQATHIPGLENRLADLLSRQQVDQYLDECMWQNQVRETIPVDQIYL